jgi:hypothetical protein
MTFRLSFEVADRNARLLAISLSREMLSDGAFGLPQGRQGSRLAPQGAHLAFGDG